MTTRKSFDPMNEADMVELRATIAKEIEALNSLAAADDLRAVLRSVEAMRLQAAEDGFDLGVWGDTLTLLDRLSILGNAASAARELIEKRAPWFTSSHDSYFEHCDAYPWSE